MEDAKGIRIAYQNKDIVSKIFGETMREKSLKVYGLDIPRVAGVMPTNLPSIEVNEQRIDNIFLLEDGSYAIIDYESKYSEVNKLKYIGYILRVLRKLQQDGIFPGEVRIRLIILYTADVKPKETLSELNVGAMQLVTEEAFLSEIDGEKELQRIADKLAAKLPLADEDLMKFIIAPLTFAGKRKKKAAVKEAAQLAKDIMTNQEQQMFALAGLLSFSDKIIDNETAEEIRRFLTMTKVGRIIEEEKIAYGKKVAEEVTEEVTREVTREVTEEVTREVTRNVTESSIIKLILFCKKVKISMEDVVENIVSDYGLSEEAAREKVSMYY